MQRITYDGRQCRIASIICADSMRHADLASLAKACGLEIIDVAGAIYPDGIDVLMIELPTESDHFFQSISETARYLETHRCIALVWTSMEMLETVYATFHNKRIHYFIGAEDSEAVPILAGIGRDLMNQVRDHDHDLEFGALHKMSDELARFARTLARTAEQDSTGSVVADKPVSFRPAPAGSFQPFPNIAAASDHDEISAQAVRKLIKLRRLRDSYFAADLFADPAWDILLDLMAAQLEERPVSVSSLCIAAAVPPTTALRWITAMTENGILVRKNDPEDARRVFIGLSLETAVAMRQYLTIVRQNSASAV